MTMVLLPHLVLEVVIADSATASGARASVSSSADDLGLEDDFRNCILSLAISFSTI